MHQSPDRAKELARRSVNARRRAIDEAQNRPGILPPKSPEELVNQLAQIFADVGNGKIDVSLARTMANVGQVILKGLEIVDVKKELKEIEELLYGAFWQMSPDSRKQREKRLILESLRQFPNLTDEELRFALKTWKLARSGTPEEMEHLWDHNCFPNGSRPCFSVPTDSRPRLHGEAERVITEGKAQKLIDELAPIIPVGELREQICLQVERNRRTQAEFNFLIQYGHWPDFEPSKTELDIKHFREQGCWPSGEDDNGKL